MRHTTLSGWTLMFTLASVGVGGAQAGVPRPSSPAPDLGRTVTMTGCLRSWDGSPAGIGRGDATGPGAQFVLTNVEETAPATPRSPVGTSGSGAAAPATTAAVAHDTYVVQPSDPQLALGPFLNQQIEVSGTLQVIPPHDASAGGVAPVTPEPAGSPAPQTGAATPSVPGSAGTQPKTPVQRVTVSTIRTVAKTCP
jgi:hypothetical protein